MDYHCVNDPLWTYCKDSERWAKENERIRQLNPEIKIISSAQLKCTLDKETCGNNYNLKRDPRTNMLGGGIIKETVFPITNETNGNKDVKKSKNKKENIQESLF